MSVSHQQRVLVGLAEGHAVHRVLVRAQWVDGDPAVVDEAVEQAEFGRGPAQLSHADVNADVRQAAVSSHLAQSSLQFLSAGFSVAAETGNEGHV